MCNCGVYSIDLQNTEIANFSTNAGLNFMDARYKTNLIGTNYCYICLKDCF